MPVLDGPGPCHMKAHLIGEGRSQVNERNAPHICIRVRDPFLVRGRALPHS